MLDWGAPWMGHKRRGLRYPVIGLLQRGPMTGAELIDAMERMSHGCWRPSPGSIYPLLEELVTEEVARRREDGRYELVPSAKFSTAWPFGRASPRTAADAVRDLGALVSYLEDLGRTDGAELKSLRDQLRQTAKRLEQLIG